MVATIAIIFVISPKNTSAIHYSGVEELAQFIRDSAESYKQENPAFEISTQQTAGSIAEEKFVNGEDQIIGLNYLPNDAFFDKADDANIKVDIVEIASEAVAVITNRDNVEVLDYLTPEQVQGIFFDGSISDWSELTTNKHGHINIFGYSANNSSLMRAFESIASIEEPKIENPDINYVNNSLEMKRQIKQDSNAIGFISSSFIDPEVFVLGYGPNPTVNRPTKKSIESEEYLLTYSLFILFDHNQPSQRDFVDYLLRADNSFLDLYNSKKLQPSTY